MSEKLVQLMSGGFDSAGQAILLHEQGFEIYPLFVNFRKGGGKVEKEMRAVELVSERMGWAKPGVIKHHIPRVYTGAGKRKKSNQTRNRTMCKIAGSYAEQIGATHVAIGTAYMPEFAHMFTHPEADSTQSILQEQMPSGITIQTLDMYKTTLLMNIPAKYRMLLFTTTSCHMWYKQECGVCYSCTERHAAFLTVMGFDHTTYAEDPKSAPSWRETWEAEVNKLNQYLEEQK